MPENTITVVGSANVDLIMKMDRLPRAGETVTDAVFLQTFGGKGANQALAAARAGGRLPSSWVWVMTSTAGVSLRI